MIFRPGPGRRSRAGLELEALEDRVLPQSTPTIVVLGLGDPPHVSNLTPPGKGQSSWTAPDLRSAILNAGQTGSTSDTVVVPGSVIDLSRGALEVGPGLDLTIKAGSGTATIDARLRSQILVVDAGATALLQDLTLSEGEAGNGQGGAVVNDGALTLLGCRVVNSVAVGPAGGPGGYAGGGIDNEGSLTIRDSVIADNRVVGSAKTADGTAANGAFGQEVFGGGVYDNGLLTAVDSTFSGNMAVGGSVSGNISGMAGGDAFGGAIAIFQFPAGITGCTFSNNQAVGGDVISTPGGAVSNGDVYAGIAEGGALFQQGTNAQTLTVVNSTFAFNTARGGNGVPRAGARELAHPGFAGGGGLYLGTDHNTVELVNDTVAYNSALSGSGPGAGIPAGAGGVLSDGPGVSVWNSLVARNTARNAASPSAFASDVSGTLNSQGHNLVGTADGSTAFSAALHDLFGGNGKPAIDPKLDTALRSNGGPTQTLALLAGSPAIDRGDSGVLASPPGVTTDQRGVARTHGSAVDIGAFEFVAAPTPWPVLAGGHIRLPVPRGPQQLVIRTPQDLLAAAGPDLPQLAAVLNVAAINWTTQMVVLVSQGFGVYGPVSPAVSIAGLTLDNNTLTVHWGVGPNLPAIARPGIALTDPAAFVVVPRFDGPVTFVPDGAP
jgi:hypothetical protein